MTHRPGEWSDDVELEATRRWVEKLVCLIEDPEAVAADVREAVALWPNQSPDPSWSKADHLEFERRFLRLTAPMVRIGSDIADKLEQRAAAQREGD